MHARGCMYGVDRPGRRMEGGNACAAVQRVTYFLSSDGRADGRCAVNSTPGRVQQCLRAVPKVRTADAAECLRYSPAFFVAVVVVAVVAVSECVCGFCCACLVDLLLLQSKRSGRILRTSGHIQYPPSWSYLSPKPSQHTHTR